MVAVSSRSGGAARLAAGAGWALGGVGGRVVGALGGRERTRVIVVLACVLGLSGADTATVGATASELRSALSIDNTDIGLLVAVTSVVAAAASLPFGVLADRVRRTWTLGATIVFWGAAMIWSASATSFDELLLARLFLGGVTAAAGPVVASLVGDYFPGAERGKIYGYILAGELLGAGFGFAVTGGIAALSWRAAFVVLALPALLLAWEVLRLPEPARGGRGALLPENGAGGVAADQSLSADDAGQTDAQQLAQRLGIEPDPDLVLTGDGARMSFPAAVRYVLRVRSNVVLIAASACGYYFLAGLETFGLEFAKSQYRIDQGVATVALLVVGLGGLAGVLSGGIVGDALLRHGRLDGRVLVSAVSATAATVLFLPALFTRGLGLALLYLSLASFGLSAQNPPLDAARLDIMPASLWGRAEAVRTFLRDLVQSLAPVLFGAMSDYAFGGGRSGLQWTFLVMLAPLAASAFFLFKALPHYPRDVATAAASAAASAAAAPAVGAAEEGAANAGP